MKSRLNWIFPLEYEQSQSENWGLKTSFLVYTSTSTGLQLVEKWYYLSREKPVWDFTGTLKSRLCRDRFHAHKWSLTGLQWSKVFMNEKKTSFSDWDGLTFVK
jgi:hypothetical protein